MGPKNLPLNHALTKSIFFENPVFLELPLTGRQGLQVYSPQFPSLNDISFLRSKKLSPKYKHCKDLLYRRTSLKEATPSELILLSSRLSTFKAVFLFNPSPRAMAPSQKPKFPLRPKNLRLQFTVKASAKCLKPKELI